MEFQSTDGEQMTELASRIQQDIESGLSQRQIAKKANVSEGTIRNALQGKNLSHDVLINFAKYLKVSIEETYRMAGLFPPPKEQSRYMNLAMHLFSQLPEQYQARLLRRLQFEVEEINQEIIQNQQSHN
jgi:transcriptional regulator with XRE-family HTH domain